MQGRKPPKSDDTSALNASQNAANRGNLTPDQILERLLEGNKRFMRGMTISPRPEPDEFSRLADAQYPIAVVVGCADSRVSPELLFDQGMGDLFVVRIAGNVVYGAESSITGSIEFAVRELGVTLVLVLGHSQCGAVTSAVRHIDADDVLPGAIEGLVKNIKPAVIESRSQPGDLLENAIRTNVRMGVERLKILEPTLAPPVKAGRVKIIGGVYDLYTGGVTIVA